MPELILRMHPALVGCLLAGGIFAPPIASAQGLHPGVAVGLAVPFGDLGARRLPGPVAHVYTIFGDAEKRVRLQVGAEGAWMLANGYPVAPGTTAEGNLRVLGLLGSVLLAPAHAGARPYFSLGGGMQWLDVENRTNPYGIVFGVRSGVGVEAPWRGRSVRADISVHAVLSDYGTGRDFSAGTYIPITLAIQF